MLTVTLVVAPLAVAPAGVPVTWIVTELAAVPEATAMVKMLPGLGSHWLDSARCRLCPWEEE